MILRILYLAFFSGFFSLIWAQEIKLDTLKIFTKEVERSSTAYSSVDLKPIPVREIQGENLGEVLQKMSSVFVKTYGLGGLSTISLRGGSASQTQVFWEGVATNSPTLGQSDLSLIPAEFNSSIYIHHAGSSAQAGYGGLAGSVNLETSGHASSGGSAIISKEVGSFGLNNTFGRVSLSKEKYRISSETIILKKSSDNNFSYRDYSQINMPGKLRINADLLQYGFQQNFGFIPKKGRIKLLLNYVDTERGVPVAIGVQDQGQRQFDKNLKTLFNYRLVKSKNMEDEKYREFTHDLKIAWIRDYLHYINQTVNLNSEYITNNWSAQLHSKFELQNNWTLKTQVSEYLYQANSAGFDEVKMQNQFSLFGRISKEWDKGLLNLSVRELVVDEKFSIPMTNIGGFYDFNLGNQELKLFGNTGNNYRYPTLNDLYWLVGGNPNLSPETSINGEIGIRTQSNYSSENRLNYGFTYFQDYVNDWIQWIPNETGIWSPENVKSVVKNGYEVQGEFTRKCQDGKIYVILNSSYRRVNATVASSYYGSDDQGKDLIYSPRNVFNLDVTARLKSFEVRYNQTITGKFYLDRDNSHYMPYSAPANVSLVLLNIDQKSQYLSNFKLSLSINNVWNEEYQVVANQPMPGRWYSVKMKIMIRDGNFGKAN